MRGCAAAQQVYVLEMLRLAPAGSDSVSRFLEQGADALVEARAPRKLGDRGNAPMVR